MDAPPTRGSDSFGSLWQSSGRPLRFRRQLSLPNLFTKSTDALAHEWPSLQPLFFPPSRSAAAGTQMSQGKMAQAYSNSPPSGGSNRGCWESFQLLKAAPWPIPLRRTSFLKRMAQYGIHGPSYGPCMCGHSTGAFVLPERVLNTMAEARAPFTRRLYALKWYIFSAWCQTVTRSTPMCQWFFHFCRGCWINIVPHPPSQSTRQP